MILDLKISDFNISGEPIPEVICDKILEHHVLPLQAVCDSMTVCVFISLNSGYRSKKWELDHGRSGNSQHCFKDKGAADLSCDDFSHNKEDLLESLIKNTDYTRFAIYNSFIHVDYKDNKRSLYNVEAGKWIFKKNV